MNVGGFNCGEIGAGIAQLEDAVVVGASAGVVKFAEVPFYRGDPSCGRFVAVLAGGIGG